MDKAIRTGIGIFSQAQLGKPRRPPGELAGQNVLAQTFIPDARSRITLPTAKGGPVQASHIGIGTWSWGDSGTWGWEDGEMPALREAWRVLHAAGVNFLDTAQVYGGGASERIVGELVAGLPRDSFVVQTKWAVSPASLGNYFHPAEAPVKSLRESLARLRLEYVDVYLVHGPLHPQSIRSVAKGLAQCVDQGLARAVGVSNYSNKAVLEMKAALAEHGVPLAANQVEFSVLRRYPEIHGGIATCRDSGAVLEGYAPLAQGRLTGKYTVANPPPKTRNFSFYPMEAIEPTLKVLESIAAKRNQSVASVALNYSLSKGVVPIVGVRNPEQAKQAIGALGWRLDQDDMVEIDKVSVEGKTTAQWQHG